MRRREDAELREPTHINFDVTTLGDERVVKRTGHVQAVLQQEIQ